VAVTGRLPGNDRLSALVDDLNSGRSRTFVSRLILVAHAGAPYDPVEVVVYNRPLVEEDIAASRSFNNSIALLVVDYEDGPDARFVYRFFVVDLVLFGVEFTKLPFHRIKGPVHDGADIVVNITLRAVLVGHQFVVGRYPYIHPDPVGASLVLMLVRALNRYVTTDDVIAETPKAGGTQFDTVNNFVSLFNVSEGQFKWFLHIHRCRIWPANLRAVF
jgi:hypothetical protein